MLDNVNTHGGLHSAYLSMYSSLPQTFRQNSSGDLPFQPRLSCLRPFKMTSRTRVLAVCVCVCVCIDRDASLYKLFAEVFISFMQDGWVSLCHSINNKNTLHTRSEHNTNQTLTFSKKHRTTCTINPSAYHRTGQWIWEREKLNSSFINYMLI